MTSSEKLAKAGKLLNQSKARREACVRLMAESRQALEEADALTQEAKHLLAEVRGEIILEGEE